MGYEKFIQPKDGDKAILIDFGGILDMPDLSSDSLNKMELKKRAYFTLVDNICNSISKAFDACEEKIIIPYVSILYKIKDTKNKYTEDEFISDIVNKIHNPDVVSYVKKWVNENYTETMDEKTNETKKTKKINTELQFTDQHNKILIAISEAIRISCPLVTEYINVYDKPVDETLYRIFSSIVQQYQENVDMLNKIHRFTYSRVVSTQYSDKTIWNLLRNKSKNIDIITQEFVQDIIIGILPKSDEKKNIINLFHVVIKRKLQFEFSKNYKITFKPLNLNQVDSEGLTQNDKFDINISKKNEAISIINRLSVSSLIPKLKEKYNVKFSKQEFIYYRDNIKIHDFQRNVIFNFFAKDIGSFNNIYSASRKDYIKLLIICYKYLKRRNIDLLAKYLIADGEKLQEKRISSRNSKIVDTIETTKIYKDLLNNKYKNIENLINENKVIIKTIGNLSVSKFIELPDYEESKEIKKDGNENINHEICFDLTKMINDYLTFLSII